MTRPDSLLHDVWLRKNIEEVEVEEEDTDDKGETIIVKKKYWEADEVYLLTDKTEQEIEADFDNIYYESGPQPTVEERLDVLEGVIGEMMEG
ncbi:MAG: hypothetical protein IJ193_07965 [Bacilli bacterium]|nr:hypothetical protein [Bacilli bacterium]